MIYPLVIEYSYWTWPLTLKFAIQKQWFSRVMFVYRRVSTVYIVNMSIGWWLWVLRNKVRLLESLPNRSLLFWWIEQNQVGSDLAKSGQSAASTDMISQQGIIPIELSRAKTTNQPNDMTHDLKPQRHHDWDLLHPACEISIFTFQWNLFKDVFYLC